MLSLYIFPTMIISFLLLTLIVGVYYSGRITSLREYAIGNKNFATATISSYIISHALWGRCLDAYRAIDL